MSYAHHCNANFKNYGMFFLSFCLIGLLNVSLQVVHAKKHSKTIATGLETSLIISGEWAKIIEESGQTEERLLGLSWEVRPHIDLDLNDIISVGGEIGLLWFNTQDEVWQGRRLVISPAMRVRMNFPIDCRWVIEGLFAGGFNTWGLARGLAPEEGGARLWGLGMRLQLGIRYIANTKVHLLLAGSFISQQVYDEQEVYELLAFPIIFGIRGIF